MIISGKVIYRPEMNRKNQKDMIYLYIDQKNGSIRFVYYQIIQMKRSSKQQTIKQKPKISQPLNAYTFPNISNQDCIRTCIKLLGITDQQYQKQTKSSLHSDLFPRNTSANSSKAFFFICQLCLKYLCTAEQMQQVQMWYPPRTANEQIQFKKSFFKVIQRLQSQGSLPKNIVLSKTSIAGDTTNEAVILFLRLLTEFALRALYVDKFSKSERLIQIALTQAVQVDINSFYPYPFCESTTNVQPPLKGEELQAIKSIFKVYLQRYRQKILSLQLSSQTQLINPQQLMSQLLQQRQISNALTSKINTAVFGENRAFDRRVAIDKHRQLWKQLQGISCAFAEPVNSSVLKVEGDIGKLISGWRTVTGTHTLTDFNAKSQDINTLKGKVQQILGNFKLFKETLLGRLK